MIDYNDGEWHGWNGGDCPVHPKSVVDVKFNDGEEYKGRDAEDWIWKGAMYKIIAFRVTEPYVEPPKPREFWIVETDGTTLTFQNEGLAKEYARDFGFYVIHVREVIEE